MLMYYVPIETAVNLEVARRKGLGHAFDSPEVNSCGNARGPGGIKGQVCSQGQITGGNLAYLPDEQTWIKIPGTECHVGKYNSELIPPQELARPRQLDGYWIELGDGQKWLVPIALQGPAPNAPEPQLRSALPMTLGLDAEGRWISSGILPAYEPLWEAASKWWDATVHSSFDEDSRQVQYELSVAEALDLCVTILAVNYRIGKAEAALLGLLTDFSRQEVLDAAIDMPRQKAWAKKNVRLRPESSNTADGRPDSGPNTDRASTISSGCKKITTNN